MRQSWHEGVLHGGPFLRFKDIYLVLYMFNSINSKERTSNTTNCLIRLELLLLTLLVSPTTFILRSYIRYNCLFSIGIRPPIPEMCAFQSSEPSRFMPRSLADFSWLMIDLPSVMTIKWLKPPSSVSSIRCHSLKWLTKKKKKIFLRYFFWSGNKLVFSFPVVCRNEPHKHSFLPGNHV